LVKIIIPYIFENEIQELQNRLWDLPVDFQEDIGKIGSDLMYQKMWNENPTEDIFIMHSDMLPIEEDTSNQWFSDVLHYANKYPEAGMLGCKLLYPAKSEKNNFYIQCAGGQFNIASGMPDHYGSGLDINSGNQFKELEEDVGQYDYVREVAWTTFGGLYIRRELINQIGDFDPSFEWTYNRDVDYCFEARNKGWKIYQIPVPLLHYESKDNKRLMHGNSELNAKWARNMKRLQEKWANSPLWRTINEMVL